MDSSAFEVRQVWYNSKDGTRVPMFLAYRKGIQLDGSNPALLTGYGGFDVSELPVYRAESAAWIANGGIYALANLRGGSEFGEEWHRAGMMEKKQNVFDDFIAAAEWLVKNKYTRPERLAIRGTSNGGLLVGVALTQRPDLVGAVGCGILLHYDAHAGHSGGVPVSKQVDDLTDEFGFLYWQLGVSPPISAGK